MWRLSIVFTMLVFCGTMGAPEMSGKEETVEDEDKEVEGTPLSKDIQADVQPDLYPSQQTWYPHYYGGSSIGFRSPYPFYGAQTASGMNKMWPTSSQQQAMYSMHSMYGGTSGSSGPNMLRKDNPSYLDGIGPISSTGSVPESASRIVPHVQQGPMFHIGSGPSGYYPSQNWNLPPLTRPMYPLSYYDPNQGYQQQQLNSVNFVENAEKKERKKQNVNAIPGMATGWRKRSYIPIPGQSGCFNRCWQRCDPIVGFGGSVGGLGGSVGGFGGSVGGLGGSVGGLGGSVGGLGGSVDGLGGSVGGGLGGSVGGLGGSVGGLGGSVGGLRGSVGGLGGQSGKMRRPCRRYTTCQRTCNTRPACGNKMFCGWYPGMNVGRRPNYGVYQLPVGGDEGNWMYYDDYQRGYVDGNWYNAPNIYGQKEINSGKNQQQTPQTVEKSLAVSTTEETEVTPEP